MAARRAGRLAATRPEPVPLSRFLARLRKDDPVTSADGGKGTTHPTRVLGRFIKELGARVHPVVVDLGPVVGSNVAFFGEQLGCKILVEDLPADIESHARAGTLEQLPTFLARRFPQSDESVDGILCWDVFDHLDGPARTALARELVRVLRPGGALLAMFNAARSVPGARPEYRRYVVVAEDGLEYRPYEASSDRQSPLPNREIQLLFEPLRITDQFLLKTHMREVLLRKPDPRTAV